METPYDYMAQAHEYAVGHGLAWSLNTTAVCAYLFANALDGGLVEVSRNDIADYYGMTAIQVRYSLAKLADCGLISHGRGGSTLRRLAYCPGRTIGRTCKDFNSIGGAETQSVNPLSRSDYRSAGEIFNNSQVIENQAVEKTEKSTWADNGRDGGALTPDLGTKRDSPHTPHKEKLEEYIYPHTPQPPKGGVARPLSAASPAPNRQEGRCDEVEGVETVEAESESGDIATECLKNESRGAKNGLGGESGVVDGAEGKSGRKTPLVTLFANCAPMMSLATTPAGGGDPVPDNAKLAALYPDWASKGADVGHYWLAAYLWSYQRNQKRTARGWRATLTNWMRTDEARGRLVTVDLATRCAVGGDIVQGYVEEMRRDRALEEQRRQAEVEYARRLFGR